MRHKYTIKVLFDFHYLSFFFNYWFKKTRCDIWLRLIMRRSDNISYSDPVIWKWEEVHFLVRDIDRNSSKFLFSSFTALTSFRGLILCPLRILFNESLNYALSRNKFGDLSGRQVHPGTEYGFGTSYHGAVDVGLSSIQNVSQLYWTKSLHPGIPNLKVDILQ